MKKLFNMIALLLNDSTYKKRDHLLTKTLNKLVTFFLFLIKRSEFLRYILKSIYSQFLDWPKLLMIHPGQDCNLKCIYCYDEEDRKEKEDILSIEEYEKILDQAKRLGISQIQILGGEPLLYKNIKRLIKKCCLLDLDIVIYSNATLLDQTWIDYLLKFQDKITILVSCDPKETYLETCGKDLFDKADENIKKAIHSGLKVRFFIPVTKMNFDFIKDYAIKRCELNNLVPVFERYLPIGKKEIDEKLMLNKEQWNEIIKLSSELQKKYQITPIGEIVSSIRGTGCNDFYESIHISNTGEIAPCDYLIGKYSIGNIKDLSLKKVWNIYRHYRKKWNKLPDECVGCKHIYKCNGGCKAWTYLNHGVFDKKDSLCDNSRSPFIY